MLATPATYQHEKEMRSVRATLSQRHPGSSARLHATLCFPAQQIEIEEVPTHCLGRPFSAQKRTAA